MRVVWKYRLLGEDRQTIDMPQGARVLSVQLQANRFTAWALVDDEMKDLAPVNFVIAGTGNPISGLDYATWRFLGAVQAAQGLLVSHVFVQDGLLP